MRVAGVILAVMLIAACPPRRARVVYVQPCPAPYVIVPAQPAPPPAPPVTAAKPVDPAVEAILTGWEKKMAEITNVRTEITLKRTEAASTKETNYAGVVLWMKPNYAVLRLDNTVDPTKADYEAYICDGKKLYTYDGNTKTITEFKLPTGWPAIEAAASHPALGLLAQPKAEAIRERFDVTVYKTDEHYIYLDIKPAKTADQSNFQQIRMALYNPKVETRAYLPAQLYILRPNGDKEFWKFGNPQVDILSVRPENFQFVPIKGWSGFKPPPAKPAPIEKP